MGVPVPVAVTVTVMVLVGWPRWSVPCHGAVTDGLREAGWILKAIFWSRKSHSSLCRLVVPSHVFDLAQLLPDGAELIERFIAAEGDTSSRRSAFLFLYNEAEELAIDFLNEHMDDVSRLSLVSCLERRGSATGVVGGVRLFLVRELWPLNPGT